MQISGIDVSAYTGTIQYSRVAEAGIQAAVLRITESGNVVDPTFEDNYSGFQAQKIKVGVYKYSYALTTAQAETEAEKVLEVLGGRELSFPVFYDVEDSSLRSLSRDALTEMIQTFRGIILNGGYAFGIYCNMDWYNNVLDTSSLPYDYWLAAYPDNDQGQIVESLRPAVGIGWQYTDNGSVAGISGPVDRDVFYKDDFESGKDPYKEWVGECTANGVNVRRGPGTEYAPITGYPRLDRGNLVDVIGEKRARDCGLWYFVRIAGQYEGYVYHTYLKQA